MMDERVIRQLTRLDRMIHEPARLAILMTLRGVEEADFPFLARITGLTRGNLSVHLSRLEQAGYVTICKTFVGKKPRTVVRLTDAGREALERYMTVLRSLTGPGTGSD